MKASEDITIAPWSEDEIKTLNDYQRAGVWHPFTCFNEHDGERDLIATEDGWKCPNCDFKQLWSWRWMMDPERWPNG